MALTEEQLEELALQVDSKLCSDGHVATSAAYAIAFAKHLIAALPKPEPAGEIVAFSPGLHEVAWPKGKMPPLGSVLYTESPIAQPASAPSEQKPILWAAYYGNKLKNVYRTKEKAEQLRLYNGLEKPVAVPLYLAPQPDYKAQRDALLEVAKKASEALDIAQSLLESAKSYHHKKVLNAYNETVAAIASVKGGE